VVGPALQLLLRGDHRFDQQLVELGWSHRVHSTTMRVHSEWNYSACVLMDLAVALDFARTAT
jgi:hypothetical protein